MSIIIKTIYCFSNCSIKNQKETGKKNARQEVLKERIEEINLEHETIAHNNIFTRNKTILNKG